MLWAVAIVLVVGGLVAVAIGLRGRRVGSAPHCRGCGFDLSGIVDRAAACPECGRSLAEGRAVVVGARRRRPWFVVVGAAAFIAAVGAAGLGVSAANPSWNSYKPARLLVFEASALRGPVADAAAAELVRRSAAGTLAPERLAGVIDACLRVQEDRVRAWHGSPWAILLDDAFAAGMPDAAQTELYIRNAMSTPRFHIPDRALAGYSWPVRHRLGGPDMMPDLRVVNSRFIGYVVTLERLELNGVPLGLVPLIRHGRQEVDWNMRTQKSHSSSPLRSEFPAHLPAEWSVPEGDNEVRAVWKVRTSSSPALDFHGGESVTESMFDIVWEFETMHRIRGYARPEDMVRVIGSDTSPAPAVAINPASSIVRASMPLRITVPFTYPRDEEVFSIAFSVDRFDSEHEGHIVGTVELRIGDRSWPLRRSARTRQDDQGSDLYRAVIESTWISTGSTVYVFDLPFVDTVDVAIIPDLHWAARLGTVETLWGEEIVIRGVPLDWSEVAEDFRPAPPSESGGDEADEDDAPGAVGEGGR